MWPVYPNLSVSEHLGVYARLKGLQGEELSAEVHALLKDSAWCSSMGLERCLTDSLWMHEPYSDNDFSTSCR